MWVQITSIQANLLKLALNKLQVHRIGHSTPKSTTALAPCTSKVGVKIVTYIHPHEINFQTHWTNAVKHLVTTNLHKYICKINHYSNQQGSWACRILMIFIYKPSYSSWGLIEHFTELSAWTLTRLEYPNSTHMFLFIFLLLSNRKMAEKWVNKKLSKRNLCQNYWEYIKGTQ